MQNKRQFFEHIGGLRALAIVPVLLFHMNGEAWPLGYLGVDIFLVISGYLLFCNTFASDEPLSIKATGSFVLRRVKRLVAPMSIVILLTVVAGMLFLLPDGELFNCKVGLAACFGKSNVTLTKEMSDYFAPKAAYTPLLHMWYLSMLMQVYLIFAVGGYVVRRMPRKAAIACVALVGLSSLAMYYSYPLHNRMQEMGLPTWKQISDVSYYATLPRLWEVLAGGLVLLMPRLSRKWLSTLLAVGGVIVVAFFSLSGGVIEGLRACPCIPITVAATLCIIRYLPESHLPRLLSHKVMLWLGGISFSVYLVHMPIIVYFRLWEYGEFSVWQQILMVVVSFAAGWGFWWCVEKRRMPLWVIILLWVFTCGVCYAGKKTDGFKAYQYEPKNSLELSSYEDWQICRDEALCRGLDTTKIVPWRSIFTHMGAKMPEDGTPLLLTMGDAKKPANILLMGDSHALHSYPGMDHMFRSEGLSGVYLDANIYPFLNLVIEYNPKSFEYNPAKEQALFDWLRAHPQITHVVIAQRWVLRMEIGRQHDYDYPAGLRAFLQKLKDMGIHVILIAPTPEYEALTPNFLRISALKGEKTPTKIPTCSLERYHDIHKNVLPVLKQMETEGYCTLIDPLVTLSKDDTFRAMDEEGLLMIDDNHYSVQGALLLMQQLWPQLRKALPEPKD